MLDCKYFMVRCIVNYFSYCFLLEFYLSINLFIHSSLVQKFTIETKFGMLVSWHDFALSGLSSAYS